MSWWLLTFRETMADLLADGYIEEQSAQRKAVESAPSISMVCNILSFLDASPMTLFEGPPADRSERDQFYEENLGALISCIIAADESVRRLAAGVAKRLFAKEGVLSTLRASKGLGSKGFKTKFWRLTYVFFVVTRRGDRSRGLTESRSLILISICDRARLPCTAEALKSVNGYLESRLLLLTSIPVCELGSRVASVGC
jgi:neurofibromin 1